MVYKYKPDPDSITKKRFGKTFCDIGLTKDKEGNQYKIILNNKTKDWDPMHKRVILKKLKLKKIPAGFVIHHIDQDKMNNKYENLILIHRKQHNQLHKKHRETLKEYPLIKKKS